MSGCVRSEKLLRIVAGQHRHRACWAVRLNSFPFWLVGELFTGEANKFGKRTPVIVSRTLHGLIHQKKLVILSRGDQKLSVGGQSCGTDVLVELSVDN
jgi:hypothetical protein